MLIMGTDREWPALGGSGTIWTSPAEWARMRLPEQCRICLSGGPHNVLVELDASFACGGPRAPIPGYVCVVARRHVVEPFELPPDELQMFWQDAMIVGRALNELLNPSKINYEIHGNSMPHLHMHVYPRTADDPYVGGPIDWHERFERSADDLGRLRDAIVTARVHQAPA